ncbi:hypothetical protein CE91St36_13560 [Christensenellaceae bacterium]|nr:hypothetical protein CE91St36_13560 [Christensenellaceae bacterium]BDF61207.1 hypothetical protein CE91St37_13570 [Christensenellaceae bacterium]
MDKDRVRLIRTPEEHIAAYRALYEEAFPKNEQFPFDILLKRYRKGSVEFLSLVDNGTFVGLMITAEYEGRVLLNYFAIDGTRRGKGYGSSALALLKERIRGKELFLDIELAVSEAPNKEQRKKRKAFYLRNGLVETSLRYQMFGDKFEMLSDGADMDIATLRVMLGRIFGKFTGLILKMVLKPLK